MSQESSLGVRHATCDVETHGDTRLVPFTQQMNIRNVSSSSDRTSHVAPSLRLLASFWGRLRSPSWRARRAIGKRQVGWLLGLLCCLAQVLSAAEILDRKIIEDPRQADMDSASAFRWERLFAVEQRWIGRDLAFIETHQPERVLSLFVARLLYRGNPWTRRLFVGGGDRWRSTDNDVRQAVLRVLRYHREAVLGDVYCAFLAQETDPLLAIAALANLHLVDPAAATSWALRLADPRHPIRLPACQSFAVRAPALALLVETHGADAAVVRAPLAWAMLNADGVERNHALRLVPRGGVPDLLGEVILRLTKDFFAGVLDENGRFSLVLAATRITGVADKKLVDALGTLAVKGDRALAAAATTALTSGITWDVAIAINDLAERAGGDPDPVIRQTLMALLVRLDPSAVPQAAGPASPWSLIAEHIGRLQEWDAERTGR